VKLLEGRRNILLPVPIVGQLPQVLVVFQLFVLGEQELLEEGLAAMEVLVAA
tara:strand:+ start:144 stop:299 length:156 start_codon:yes stop_codon:yes gene_type:complete